MESAIIYDREAAGFLCVSCRTRISEQSLKPVREASPERYDEV